MSIATTAVLRSAAVFLVAATLVTGCQSAHEKAEGHLKRADALYAAKDLPRARLEVQNALQIDPRNARGRYLLALISESEGDYRAVLDNLLAAVNADPKYLDARVKLGNYYAVGGKVGETRAQADAALALAPSSPSARVLSARAFYIAGEKTKAVDEANAALALDPKRWDAITLIASIHAEAGRTDDALAVVEKGINAADADAAERLRRVKVVLLLKEKRNESAEQELLQMASAYPRATLYDMALARLYTSQGRVTEAEKRIRALIAREPASLDWRVQLARLLIRQQKPDLAEESLKLAVRENPNSATLKFALADFYVAAKRPPEAAKIYDDMAKAAPRSDDGLAARNQLVALTVGDNPQKARELVGSILADVPTNGAALLYRAAFSIGDKRINEAIADLRTVLVRDPRSERALLLLARCFVINGEHSLAEDTYKNLLGVNPTLIDARRELAKLLSDRGDRKQAETLLREGIEASPADSATSAGLVSTLLAQGDFKGAESEARRLQNAGSQSGLAEYELGAALQSQNEVDPAIAAYKQALEKSPLADQPLSELTRLLLQKQRAAEAEEILQRNLKEHPDHVMARILLGALYRDTKRDDLARKTFRAVIAEHPNVPGAYIGLASMQAPTTPAYLEVLAAGHANLPADPQIALALGAAYEKRAAYEQAMTVYEKFIAAGGANDFITSNLAALMLDYRHDKASHARALQLVSHFQKTATHPFQLAVLGWAYYRNEQFANAVRVLDRAVAASPAQNPQLRYYLGMAQLKNGDKTAASRELKLAVETADSAKTPFTGLDDARATLKNLNTGVR
jgi:tetratricopeptide (TPR) repeat protein